MLSERLLKKWRREALIALKEDSVTVWDGTGTSMPGAYLDMQDHILKLTQELLDQYLVRKS